MRYLRILFSFASLSFKRYLEHRWNTLGTIIVSILTLLTTVFFIEVIFNFTQNIQGWNKNEVLLVTGVYRIFITLLSLLVLRSVYMLPNYLNRGYLDFLLIKPLNSQFYLSFHSIRMYEAINLIPGIFLVIYSLGQMNLSVNLSQAVGLIFGLMIGLIIMYSMFFIFATFAIWMGRFGSLSELTRIFSDPLTMPIDVFGKNLSFILTFIIPLGFVITVPLKVFLGKSSIELTLGGALFASILFASSVIFWNFGLKHYTSASS